MTIFDVLPCLEVVEMADRERGDSSSFESV